MIVDKEGYITKRTAGSHGRRKSTYRNWWLVKFNTGDKAKHGRVDMKRPIHFPSKYVGKKVRFKVEIVE